MVQKIMHKLASAAPTGTAPVKKDSITDKFLSTTLQPQVFSILLVTLILVVFSIVVYNKVKKQEVNKAPHGILLFTEQYVMGVDNLFKEVTTGKIQKPAPYIFTLMTFLALSNIMGLIGLEPPTTSYSVTLTLGLISWIGIYVIGILYQKMAFFKKYLNPVEVIGQFSPLISISFRIFGNMIGGSTVMYLLYHFTGWIWGNIPVIGEFNILGPVITPALHAFFDIFDGLIQAFVFTLLTMIYWVLEADAPQIEEITETQKREQIKKDLARN